jgi:mannose-6-phosphate isomerase-like protein (cupin superfamily)
MTKTLPALTALPAALGLMLGLFPAAAGAQQAAEASVHRDAVFIGKGDFAKALEARASGKGMSAVGAVRAGNDRINVDVLRRDSPDELPTNHKLVTEIYYILEGGGDFATGGKLVDPKPMLTNGKPTNPASIGPSEKSAKVIGATNHHVVAGDVVMIPPGVVHNFTRLDGHVTYMVVRVNPDYEKGK